MEQLTRWKAKGLIAGVRDGVRVIAGRRRREGEGESVGKTPAFAGACCIISDEEVLVFQAKVQATEVTSEVRRVIGNMRSSGVNVQKALLDIRPEED